MSKKIFDIRTLHTSGSGAYGLFTVTHDITTYTKANLFGAIGRQTRVFVRMSTTFSKNGTADMLREPRGFAIRFYTEDGNWDVVGSNMPVLYTNDDRKFIDFIHSKKTDP